MARSGSLTDAGAALGDVGRELEDQLLARMLGAASFAIKTDALRIAGAVTGGDRRLSRFGTAKSRGRVKLNVGYDITGNTSTIKLRPAALWVLTNAGSRPHPIGTGKRTARGTYTKRRAKQGRQLLLIGGVVRTGPVRHPGSAGRGAVIALYAGVPGIVAEQFALVLNDRLNKGR